MAKVTAKHQVTVPKVIAEQYDIRPGDDIDWVAAGDVIRVIPPGKQAACRRSRVKAPLVRPGHRTPPPASIGRKAERFRDRGWTREDLYRRGRSR